MNYEQMCAAVREMAENSVLLLSEGDQEFILGLSIMLESDERIPAVHADRIQKIHHTFTQNRYA